MAEDIEWGSEEQIRELRRIEEDEEARGNLKRLFESAYGRAPGSYPDGEAFEWGAALSDAHLIALGFKDRADFEWNMLMILHVEAWLYGGSGAVN